MQKKQVRKNRLFRVLALALTVAGLVATLALTAFAQNTYVITDGDQVTVYSSFTDDPAKVLDQAGVQLSEQDYYTTAAGDGVSEITVQRGMPVTIDHCGEQIATTSYGETVEALLERMGIATGGCYISVPLSANTYEGMEVSVASIHETAETYTVEIPFETAYCDDPTLPAGQEQILVEGQPGQMLCQANVVYHNTTEQQRTVVQEAVIQQPITQIVAVGTGEDVDGANQPIFGDGFIVLPSGEVLTYTHTDTYVATAYTMTDDGCDAFTANGNPVRTGAVAIDPSVVPYGTRMFIVTSDGEFIYGLSTAEDCGTGVDGKRVDLYMHSTAECFQFGVQECTIYFLGDANWR